VRFGLVLRIHYATKFDCEVLAPKRQGMGNARIFDVGAVWGKTEDLGVKENRSFTERSKARKLMYR